MAPKNPPPGYHSITPYLYIRGCADALDFYQRAFGAEVMFSMPTPDGKVGHAEMRIGDSIVMLADEMPEMGAKSPQSIGGTAGCLMIYLPDVDAAFKRAISAGGTEVRAVKDQFYGDRSGMLVDPFGHSWVLSTHVEDVTPEEIERRLAKMMAEGKMGC